MAGREAAKRGEDQERAGRGTAEGGTARSGPVARGPGCAGSRGRPGPSALPTALQAPSRSRGFPELAVTRSKAPSVRWRPGPRAPRGRVPVAVGLGTCVTR